MKRDEWETVRLGDVCEVNMGQSPDSKTYNSSGEGLPFYQGNADFGLISPSATSWCSEPKKIAHKDDILISVRAPIGALNIADETCCIGRGLASLTINPELCFQKYIWHCLISKVPEFNRKGTGSTFKAINKAGLTDTEILLPPLDVQRRIAETLDKVTELISLRKTQLEKLDELVKARFVEMFGDVEYELPLIELCNFIDYRGKTPEKSDCGLPFITAKNVKMHYMSFDTLEYISKDTYDRVMTRGFPKAGDVVFTTEAPLGNVCRIPHMDTEFYIGQRIITMQTNILEPVYLEYALSTEDFRRKLSGKSSGSTVTGIRSKLLEQLTIPVPEKEMQNSFASFVSSVEETKAPIQQSLETLETLKKSLMQEYFGLGPEAAGAPGGAVSGA